MEIRYSKCASGIFLFFLFYTSDYLVFYPDWPLTLFITLVGGCIGEFHDQWRLQCHFSDRTCMCRFTKFSQVFPKYTCPKYTCLLWPFVTFFGIDSSIKQHYLALFNRHDLIMETSNIEFNLTSFILTCDCWSLNTGTPGHWY